MQIGFESNLRDIERDLSDVGRKQLPYATSVALNDTAEEIRKNQTRRLDKKLDRPTPMTKKAYAVRRSTKRRLEARVYIRPIQARYLVNLEEGGTVTPKRRAIPIAAKAKRNKYGNLPRGAIRRQLASPKTFSGTPKGGRGGPGIYQRKGRGLVKLTGYHRRAKYSPRLGFKSSAQETAARRFPVHFNRALVKAFANRRR